MDALSWIDALFGFAGGTKGALLILIAFYFGWVTGRYPRWWRRWS